MNPKQRPSGFFITGTDTGVGKTVVSAILVAALGGSYWKPIQSGIADELADKEQIQQWLDLPKQAFFPSTYSLQASLCPDQAARQENKTIELASCVLPQTTSPLIVEGAGGLLWPLNEESLLPDLIARLALPVIVVARGTLGTINHTLLTLAALDALKLPIHGVVFSGPLNPDNQAAIEKWGRVRTLFHLPLLDRLDGPRLQGWVSENRQRVLENL